MTVYLVGAGPGDPGLLTVRGAELLARADVVIHDRLSARELLDLAPADCRHIDVGKTPRGPSVPQERINELLVEHGRTARTVVRLKGGDPFVFARGAEEANALIAAGIPYEVVPGITSAIAAPAYGGVPVTMRYSSTNFTVVTGHEDPTKESSDVAWESIAAVGGTIVILMGVANLPTISQRLMAGGLPAGTPAAAVRWGTRPEQRTVRATLATLHLQDLAPPSTIVIGDVAAQQLDWFEQRPLFGTRVVVTRPAESRSGLASRLRAHGAATLSLPTVQVGEPLDAGAALRAAVGRVSEFDWVVLTSPNGVRRFCSELRDGRDLAGVQLAVIGPGTAAALADLHLLADLVPDRYVAESLLETFPDPPTGQAGRVLLPRAAVARDVLPDGLSARGWQVEVVEAYRTLPAALDDADRRFLEDADAITFTSASSVTNFVATVGSELAPPTVATIGPITTAAARDAGIDVTVEATEHTLDGLVDALVAHVALDAGGTTRTLPER